MSYHNYRGGSSKKAAQTASRRFSQDSFRNGFTSFDQHGRQFYFPAEKSTGMPCGLPEPKFSAPFEPDPQYIHVNPDNTSECYVDWLAMIRDRVRAMKQYHTMAVEVATKKNMPAPALGDYSTEIVASHPMGHPPRAFQLAVAAHQGNPWVLGFEKEPDPRLVQYLEKPSRVGAEMLDLMDFSADSYAEVVGGTTLKSQSFASRRAEAKARKGDDVLAEIQAELAKEEEELAAAAAVEDDEDGAEIDLEDGETEPTDSEGPEASLDDEDEPLVDEEEEDPEQLGGRTVKHKNTDKAKKQAPRRPTQTATKKARKPWNPEGKRSLADGAEPVIAS